MSTATRRSLLKTLGLSSVAAACPSLAIATATATACPSLAMVGSAALLVSTPKELPPVMSGDIIRASQMNDLIAAVNQLNGYLKKE